MGAWELEGWRLKVYSICAEGEEPSVELVEAARAAVRARLVDRPTKHPHVGVGFVGVHDGRGANQVFLDRWIAENELLHHVWISPKDDPAALRPAGDDDNSVCVWDLHVQGRERALWVEHVLANPNGPDVEAYLAATWDDRV